MCHQHYCRLEPVHTEATDITEPQPTFTLMPLLVWLMLVMDEGGAWLELGVEPGFWGESRRLSCDLRTSDRLHNRSVPPAPPTPPPPMIPPMSRSRSLSVSLPTRPRPRPRPISEPFRDPATWPSSPMPESVWGRPALGESSTGVGVCLSRSEKAVDGCSEGEKQEFNVIPWMSHKSSNIFRKHIICWKKFILSLWTSSLLSFSLYSFYFTPVNCLILLTKALFFTHVLFFYFTGAIALAHQHQIGGFFLKAAQGKRSYYQYWLGSWSRGGCSSLIGWWTCQSPAGAPKCRDTLRPWGPRWSRRLPEPETGPVCCHPAAQREEKEPRHVGMFTPTLWHKHRTQITRTKNTEDCTHHVSEDHRSQSIDVHILQESVGILLHKGSQTSTVVSCTCSCSSVSCLCLACRLSCVHRITLLVVEALYRLSCDLLLVREDLQLRSRCLCLHSRQFLTATQQTSAGRGKGQRH